MSNYKSFAVTVTGGSHTKHGKGCEDASFIKEETNVNIAVVADGHGDDNCFRSAKGSKFAVSCAANGIQEFISNNEQNFKGKLFNRKPSVSHNEFEKSLKETLIKYTIASWHKNIEDDYEAAPFTDEELEKADEKHRKKYEAKQDLHKAYGTTLIATAITPSYWFGIHIGDGRFTALYADGSFDQPVPWDDKCYLNVTTSICDDDAFERTRCYLSFNNEKPPPVAVFLCTDGIDDNYPVDENEKHLFKLYRTIAITFAEDGFESTFNQLKDLTNQFATKGKGDDTSIAGFIDMETLKKTVLIWKKQIAEEEKSAAEKTANANTQEITETKPENYEVNKTATQNALEAIKAYEKQKKSVKGSILSYGNFETKKGENK
ncbi:MAG: protein phosphatase 2C domain-containing protein [Treponema sp.]|jgi:serine/threonine protein phosphatase PrpC|nr:protein phosphatase 2C domain-containing protein [Treponema sp.]